MVVLATPLKRKRSKRIKVTREACARMLHTLTSRQRAIRLVIYSLVPLPSTLKHFRLAANEVTEWGGFNIFKVTIRRRFPTLRGSLILKRDIHPGS